MCHDTGEYEAWLAEIDGEVDDPAADGDDDHPLLLIYTAAFEGRPNAAMLSSRALVAQGLLMAPWSGIDAEYVFLNSGPLFHIGTFMPNLVDVRDRRHQRVRPPLRRRGACARRSTGYRCTGGFIVGPMVDAIVAANATGRYDLSSFRGKRGNPTFDAWVQPDASAWGRHAGGYGQTEVMGMATFNLLGVGGIGTHGRPSPLVDAARRRRGRPRGRRRRGRRDRRARHHRDERLLEPAGAERAPARNGWHHTNDLGKFEADGTFTFVGPKTRMLKSAAENIYPVEVENCLKDASGRCADCAVIGVPDDTWVQAVKAIVVVRRRASTSSPTRSIEHCRARIASYKKPRTVEFVDVLPARRFLNRLRRPRRAIRRRRLPRRHHASA